MFIKDTIADFTEKIAKDQATPGGGTAAAITGSMGIALLEMVIALTVKKKEFEQYKSFLKEKRANLNALRLQMQILADEDSEAFTLVMNAFSMPKNSEAEKNKRSLKIQKAFQKAAETPLDTAKTALQSLEIADNMLGKINMNAVSDFMVGVLMCEGAVQGALLNTAINLTSIKDIVFKEKIIKEINLIKIKTEQNFTKIKTAIYKEECFNLL